MGTFKKSCSLRMYVSVQDLFAVNYPSIPGAFPGWHAGPQQGYGFAMQYNMSMVSVLTPSVYA